MMLEVDFKGHQLLWPGVSGSVPGSFRGLFKHREGVSSRNSEFRSRITFSARFQVGRGTAAARCVPKSKNSDVWGWISKSISFYGQAFQEVCYAVSGVFLCIDKA